MHVYAISNKIMCIFRRILMTYINTYAFSCNISACLFDLFVKNVRICVKTYLLDAYLCEMMYLLYKYGASSSAIFETLTKNLFFTSVVCLCGFYKYGASSSAIFETLTETHVFT